MSDKLLSYLDAFPLVSFIWVNAQLEYVGGPAEGFVRMSRDEALEAIMSEAFPAPDLSNDQPAPDPEPPVDPEPEKEPEAEKEPAAELPAEPAATVVISKPPKK